MPHHPTRRQVNAGRPATLGSGSGSDTSGQARRVRVQKSVDIPLDTFPLHPPTAGYRNPDFILVAPVSKLKNCPGVGCYGVVHIYMKGGREYLCKPRVRTLKLVPR